MGLPLRQLITDPEAESQESAARVLATFVSVDSRIAAEVTRDGLLLYASSELDLEMAGDSLVGASRQLAFGKPQINYIEDDPWREPYASLIVKFPTECLADVRGDLEARRAELKRSESSASGESMIWAIAPMAELFGYTTSLRSLTHGRGSFVQEFLEYRPFPHQY
jgi:translation elongation factor EF-G